VGKKNLFFTAAAAEESIESTSRHRTFEKNKTLSAATVDELIGLHL
jgi:hypothetical protein